MILVNGTKGIGTGFSTEIMQHNPLDIISYIKNKLNDINNQKPPKPYYKGFKGSVEEISSNKYLIRGCYTVCGENKVQITELPVGTWTDDYKAFLEKTIDSKDGLVTDYSDISTDKTVNITVVFGKKSLVKKLESTDVEYNCNALEKYLKLYTTISTTNMHLFDSNEQLKKYESIEDIISDYYDRRLEMYNQRKKHQLEVLKDELVLLSNKAKYIMALLDDSIDLRRKKRKEIVSLLVSEEYDEYQGDYNYLIKMPMDSVCEENVARLLKQQGDKELEMKTLEKMPIETIWFNELDALEKMLKD